MGDGGSQGGSLVSIAEKQKRQKDEKGDGSRRNAGVLFWMSNKIKRVARSTFAGETLQATTTFDHAATIRDLYDEMTGKGAISDLHILTDCKSLSDHLAKLGGTCTERRMMSMIALLKEGLETGEIASIKHIPTQLMTADGLTKTQPKLKTRIREIMSGSLDLEEKRMSVREMETYLASQVVTGWL